MTGVACDGRCLCHKKLLAPPPTAEFIIVAIIIVMSCHAISYHAIDIMRNGATGVRGAVSPSSLCGRGARIAGARAALGRLPLTVGAARFVAAASGQCGQPAVVRLRRTLPLPKKLLAPPPTAEFVVVVVIVIMPCHVIPCHHAIMQYDGAVARWAYGLRRPREKAGERTRITSAVKRHNVVCCNRA